MIVPVKHLSIIIMDREVELLIDMINGQTGYPKFPSDSVSISKVCKLSDPMCMSLLEPKCLKL